MVKRVKTQYCTEQSKVRLIKRKLFFQDRGGDMLSKCFLDGRYKIAHSKLLKEPICFYFGVF